MRARSGYDQMMNERQKEGGMTRVSRGRVLMLLENNPYRFDTRPKREARTLIRAGYHVSVICPLPPGGRVYEVMDGVHLYQFPMPQGANGVLGYVGEYGYAMVVMFLLSLIVLLREGFDVLHAHNPPDTLFLIGGFYKLFGKRFIYDHHDLAPEMYAHARFKKSGNRALHRLLLLCEQLSCRVADHVIANNESYKAIEMQRDRVPERKISIVRNGPDLKELQPVEPDPELRQRAGMILGYVGRFSEHDGVDYLLRAVQYLVYDLNRRDLLCVIMGQGEILPRLKELAAELQIADYVWFTGWIGNPEQLRRYIAATDICVEPAPSNPFNDRCSMIKLTEYMVQGRPIAAFDLPEHHFTAHDAVVYARANDAHALAHAIAALMDDPEQRHYLGQKGKRRIEQELAWQYQSERLLLVYNALLPYRGETR